MMGMVTRMTIKCNWRGKSFEEQTYGEQQTTSAVQVSKLTNKRKNFPMMNGEARPIPAARKRKTKVISKTNCQAEMVITLVKGVWTMTW